MQVYIETSPRVVALSSPYSSLYYKSQKIDPSKEYWAFTVLKISLALNKLNDYRKLNDKKIKYK